MSTYRERLGADLVELVARNAILPDGMGWTAYSEAYEPDEHPDALRDIEEQVDAMSRYVTLVEAGPVADLVGLPANVGAAEATLVALAEQMSTIRAGVERLRATVGTNAFCTEIWQLNDTVQLATESKMRLDRCLRWEERVDEDASTSDEQ